MIQSRTLYQAEAIPFLERVGSHTADLVLVDAPLFAQFTRPAWKSEFVDLESGKKPDLRHYLSFLSEVLQQCYRVLDSSGSICFLTNSWRSRDVQLLLDQVFGRDNFRAEFVWPNRPRASSVHHVEHGVILLYTKTDAFTFHDPVRRLDTEEVERRFPASDERGRYMLTSLFSPVSRPNLQFEWQGYLPPQNRSWRYSLEGLESLRSDGRIEFPRPTSAAFPRLKVYMGEDLTVPVGSVWRDIPPYLSLSSNSVQYYGQKPQALFDRIVDMSSTEGSVVVDPFCRSGVSIVAYQTSGRQWIGCESSSEAAEVAIQRLRHLGLEPERDFHTSDQASLEAAVPVVPFYYSPLVLPEDIRKIPLIVTEGKSDWKHMKAAFKRLRSEGLFEGLDLEFMEYEDEIKMGHSDLFNLCKHLSKLPQSRKVICIFDHDDPQMVELVSGSEAVYRSWGNSVYSFPIPVPVHRSEKDGVCIELYYTDDEIKTLDRNGRRIYLGSEFDNETGVLKTNPDIQCEYPGKTRSPFRIIDQKVWTRDGVSVALPKADFAENVLNAVEGFRDFGVSEFARIFELIVEISMLREPY